MDFGLSQKTPKTGRCLFPVSLEGLRELLLFTMYGLFMKDETLIHSPLGKSSYYDSNYDPSLLFPVSREQQRRNIQIDNFKLPFQGADLWNSYEISWLNTKGKPQIAIGEFFIPCESSRLVESKSFKLYLNSLYQTTFRNSEEVSQIIQNDLSQCVQAEVSVKLIEPNEYHTLQIGSLPGVCLDSLDIETNIYKVDPHLLKHSPEVVEEQLYSNLLKSNCLGTRQPDWSSIYIHYAGPKIDHASLLKYIISFRMHNEFGEHCVERIFMDLTRYCHCSKLTVYARYTRRGGIDLNPFRSNFEKPFKNVRDYRQ
jgi:7-cyano-7-deazaguanine reductase